MPNEPIVPKTTIPSKAVNQVIMNPAAKGKITQPPPAVNEYVSNGMKIIHSEETRDNIIEQLKTGDNPTAALAQTTVNVLSQLDQTSRQAGATVKPETVLQGSAPVMEQIIEIGKASGALEIDEAGIKDAAGMAVSLYIKQGMEKGTITMEDMQGIYDQSKQQAAKEQTTQPAVGRVS